MIRTRIYPVTGFYSGIGGRSNRTDGTLSAGVVYCSDAGKRRDCALHARSHRLLHEVLIMG